MSHTVEIQPAAEEDVANQHYWYARHAGLDIAERYLEAFRMAAVSLGIRPDLGRLRLFKDRRLEGIRSLPVTKPFGVHLIFYRVLTGRVQNIRVMHSMRDLPRRLLQPPEAG